jgi:hypothetical protein
VKVELTTLTELDGNETSEKLVPASAVPALEKPVACAQSAKLPPELEDAVVEAAGVADVPGVEVPPVPSVVGVMVHALAKSARAIGRITSKRRI